MKAIMTVIGSDRVGIIASVCSLLASMDINILDITQTVMEGIFTMTLLVDTSTSKHSFDEIRSALIQRGEDEGLNIHIQRTDIFNAMHRV
ncbi:MAG: ACT domain-containing protein [Synergistales bacterium]|nr:ACT domain-containing protein [Synergistales bacterium]MDY6401156.1 ACT domain-containing protein [Synergistales bacterium]MDY6404749.1 ACT domain-containing protein [Synergistales bacterium]MDY6409955.1 ACT domain-containing protein [Synergistales bacterium]MDY6414507.1 ACT domain-containing protein [Synergistales bacterium]